MFEFGFNFIGKCSKGSKFDPLMFVQFEVRFFDVRSKTNTKCFSLPTLVAKLPIIPSASFWRCYVALNSDVKTIRGKLSILL